MLTCKISANRLSGRVLLLIVLAISATRVTAQSDQRVYSDSLINGWQNWSWATVNLATNSPVHAGLNSIAVTASNYQALFLHHDAFDSSVYTNLTFWLHGGNSGGQQLQVQATLNGSAQAAVSLPPLPANAWQQISLSLAQLGVANKVNLDGFWIQSRVGTSQPTFFVDDIQFTVKSLPSVVNITVNASQMVRVLDSRLFGFNTAIWDSAFDSPATVNLLRDNDTRLLRFPGGSLSDDYHWASNKTGTNTWTWSTSFSKFLHVATNLGAQMMITVNYGSGTPEEAADWVRSANLTNYAAIRDWEIGNENYGLWETDSNSFPHDPFTYATRGRDYFIQMKAVDPTIRIGVVAVTGEDSNSNGYNGHPATNPRTGRPHNGWTPVMLTTLKNLGVMPDFLIYHRYAQAPGGENDQTLLLSSQSWTNDAADLRQQLNDYLGAASTNVELICTENNSVYSNPGKQTTSLVNGLFLADSLGQLMQTEFNGFVWWDFRNGQELSNNNDPALSGWRQYGDYGMVSATNDPYPTYYVSKLMKYFARGSDKLIRATTDYPFLSAYAAQRTNGSISLLVINKTATNTVKANVSLSGYQPDRKAVVFSYGIPQEDAARTGIGSPDIAETTFTGMATNFIYNFAPYSATIMSLAPSSFLSATERNTTGFQLRLQGQTDARFVLQASIDLRSWISISTNFLGPTNKINWIDGSTNLPQRFYRALWLP